MQQPPDNPHYPSQSSYQQQKLSPRRKRFRVGCAGATGLLLVGAFLGFLVGISVAGTSRASVNPAAIQASVATMEPAQAPANAYAASTTGTETSNWTVTQTFTGDGNEKTDNFTVGNTWKLQWSCGSGTTPENIIIDVYTSDGSPLDPGAINTICNIGNTSGETIERQGGTVYLDIRSEGGWTVQVSEQQ